MAALHRLDYFQNFQIRLHALCRGAILLHPANFCVNRTTRTSNMTEIWFSKWRLCDVMKLWNFDFWSHDHPRNQHSHQQTKFYQNRMNCGWDIPIWPSSKWRPSVIMNFRNSLMWPLSVCDSASWIHIWHWSVNIVLRYGRKMIFQMASVLSICEISISPQNLKIFGHVIIPRVSIRISIPLSST